MPESQELVAGPTPAGSSGPAGAPGSSSQDQQSASAHASALAGELSERVIDGVAWVRVRTTVRVLTVMRAVVYGMVALVALLTAAVLFTVGVVRIWDAYVPVHPVGTRVWLGYVVFGGLLFLAGGLLIGQRRARREP
jgi:hypothetical protein